VILKTTGIAAAAVANFGPGMFNALTLDAVQNQSR